jgi:RNA polymerase sigma-70 factor, ECF subfamily
VRTGQCSVADAAGAMEAERHTARDEGYAELVARHSAPIRAYALRLTGNPSTAEDVVQETLLRAWRNQESLAGRGDSVRGWLIRVAHNVVVDLMRRHRWVYPVGDGAWDSLQRPIPDHADAVITNAMLIPALRRLTAEHRSVLFELYYRCRSVAETAEAIGIPPGTVKSRAFYAVRVLRADLAPEPRHRTGHPHRRTDRRSG